jgi:hypothetical protein
VAGCVYLKPNKKTAWSPKHMVDVVNFFAYDQMISDEVFKEKRI